MRIMAVVGSRRRGNTYAMVEAACHALSEADVELLHLKDIDLRPCDGCLRCDEAGKCHVDDDMTDIVGRVAQADGFVLGTPSRWNLLSGELKVFLDRLNPLAAPESLKGKKAIVLAVGQTEGEEADSILLAADSVSKFCASAGISVVDTVTVEGCLEPDALITKHKEALDDCKAAARKLRASITKDQ